MKLNKRGWGTMEMILLSSGLLLALLVAIFFISKLYGGMDEMVKRREYYSLEEKLEEASKRYVIEKNLEITSEQRINLNTLKNNNFIDEFEDEDGNACSGYVIVKNMGENLEYNSYISCDDYQTEKY